MTRHLDVSIVLVIDVRCLQDVSSPLFAVYLLTHLHKAIED